MLKKPLLLALLASTPCFAGVPSQFIARQYTEALGRAPDPSGWQGAIHYGLATACSASSLQAIALGVFQSPEYTSKAYLPEEQVLTAYRAILGREPDWPGFHYWANALKTGRTVSDVVQSMVASPEFSRLLPAICGGVHYDPVAVVPPMDIGAGSWTQGQLEACLREHAVCSVPPQTVVRLQSTLTIPAGKVLETAGGAERRMYARQARLVRSSATAGMLVVMQPGATVRNIWLDGGRDRAEFKTALPTGGRPVDRVYPNIDYVGGDGGTITGVRSDAPLSATHIATYPVPAPLGVPSSITYAGTVTISNNLTTGYAQRHYGDGTPVAWADGISNHINGATINDNDIVDPTDVGIVIFAHDNNRQASTASNNTIVHAGHSAYGSLGLDTTNCNVTSHAACVFSGTGFTNNLIFAGPSQHVDIMLYNGTGAWPSANGLPNNCNGVRDNNCGSGGRMSGNRTILDDGEQGVQVQIAIGVDGMLDAVTSGNALNVKPIDTQAPAAPAILRCYRGAPVVNALSAGHASGALQAGVDADTDICIGH